MVANIRVGLDVSFRSPAFAVWFVDTNHWHVYGFAQKKCQEYFTFDKSNLHAELFPRIPKKTSDAEAYVHIQKHIATKLCELVPKECRVRNCEVYMEDYAYQTDPKKSGNDFKLHEIGGILKMRLFMENFVNFHTVSVSAWKAQVVGRGNATKPEIVEFVTNDPKGPCFDPLGILGYLMENLTLDEKGRRVIPKPSQDWADACCIARFDKDKPKKQAPKRKRRTSPMTILGPANSKSVVCAKLPQGFVPMTSQIHQEDDDAFI